jgi:uncharacterized membrane protein YdbT with pleckstrin-like domain
MGKKLDLPEMEILWKDRKRTIFGLPLSFTRYRLYEDRLIVSKGFLNIVEDEVMLFRIIDFKVKLSLSQRIFGVGTIELTTSDANNKELLLQSVKIPRDVKQLLSDKVMEQRKRHGVKSIDSLGESSGEILGS